MRSQDEIILDMNNTICEKSSTIVNQAKIIKNNDKCETVKLSEVIKKHEDQISTYRDKLKSLSQTIIEKEKDYAGQMSLIAAKVNTIVNYVHLQIKKQAQKKSSPNLICFSPFKHSSRRFPSISDMTLFLQLRKQIPK